MTRKSKLEEMGLMESAKKLHDDGYGYHEIAKALTTMNPNFKGSHMAIKRGLEAYDRLQIKDQMKQGLNPVDVANEDFKQRMDKNTDKLESMEKKANTILDEAMESDSITDKTRALKEARDTLAQIAKNYISIQQMYQMKFNNLEKEAFEQQAQVKKLLIIMISKVDEVVCPLCKEKAIPAIMKVLESEGE
jgi:hypothetical protein